MVSILFAIAMLILLFLLVLCLSAVVFAVRNWRSLWMWFSVLFGICVGGVSHSFILGIIAMLVAGYFLRGINQSADSNPQRKQQKATTWTPPRDYGRAPYPQATMPQKQITTIPLHVQGLEELKQKLKEME